MIEIQKHQIQMFKESEKQFQEFQKTLLEKPMEADAKEKKYDRSFFLENDRSFFLEFAKSGTESK